MTRQLRTTGQSIQQYIAQTPVARTRTAWLVTPYHDQVGYVMVTFSDPRRLSLGTVLRASISTGVILPQLDAGTPVTLVMDHGQATVVGYAGGLPSGGAAGQILAKVTGQDGDVGWVNH